MASKIELAEKKAAEANARVERLRRHDALTGALEQALKAARRKDYQLADVAITHARQCSRELTTTSEQRVAAENELLNSAGKA